MLRQCALAGIGVAIALTACESADTPPPRADVAFDSLTFEQLRNAEYRSQWPASGLAKLVDGVYSEPAAPGAATEIVVSATDWHAFGDLDGDGATDGVIVLEGDPGGSGVFFDLVPVLNRGGRPVPLAPMPLGDRVEIENLQVLPDRRVSVRMIRQGPDDPQCCPSLDVTQRYRLEGEQLVAERPEPNRSDASQDNPP